MDASRADRVLRLRDGRQLGYAEYGPSDGKPLFLFHGTPGSRVLEQVYADAAERHGVRVIAPDRPGFGLSDFQPDRAIADWPDDVLELADALHIDRFAVVGFSGGGAYAAACAWKIPHRLAGAAIVSGVGPPAALARAGMMKRLNRRLVSLIRRSPWAARVAIRFLGRLVPRLPDWVLIRAMGSMPRADRAVLARPHVRTALAADLREAFRGGAEGVAHELELFGKAWGFGLHEIRTRVHLWHGEADRSVPSAVGRFVAEAIPDCRSTFVPEAGHYLVVDLMDEIPGALFAA